MDALLDFLHYLFIQPKTINGSARLLMLVPLALSISIVYKTIRCRDLKSIPLAAAGLCAMILVGMFAVGAFLLLTFRWLA